MSATSPIEPSDDDYRQTPDASVRSFGTVVSNALKFTESGSVRVSVRPEGRLGAISVSDSGPAIPPEQHELIFEPFRQADDSATRRHGGTGLGQSISRELTTMMGGLLGVESAVGEGATFHCQLPLPMVTNQPSSQHRPHQEDQPPRAPLGLHVLVAEDNHINARVASRILQKMGCRVTLANSGRRVLALVDADGSAFDVILMDVQMPDIDGLEATLALRRHEEERRAPRLPIVAVTAKAMKGDEERCRDAGMDGYLAKPITLEGLEREIRRVTGRLPADI